MKSFLGLALALAALGCGGSPTSDDAGSDAAATVNGCTAYQDDTAGSAIIAGPSGAAPAQYAPACVQVKVGQSVTWTGDLSSHPLEASGGDSPNPIQTTKTGTTISFTFSQAGTFGFHCQAHPATMQGAVEVTP